MNKREAKREACRVGAKLLDGWLQRDYPDTEELPDKATSDRLDAAIEELADELRRRGRSE